MVCFDTFRSYSIYPEQVGVWKSTPYDSRIDVKFYVIVLKISKFDYFHLFQKIKCNISYKAGLEKNWMVCFDTLRIYSIYPERGGGRLKIDIIRFEDWRQIWHQSSEKL